MADSSSQQRNLPPTERRLRKAREEGQVARSRDLGHLVVLAGGLALLMATAPTLTAWLREVLTTGLRFDHQMLANGQAMQHRLGELLLPTVLVVLALGSVLSLSAVVAAVASGGWTFTLHPMRPDFSRINPLSGLGRLVSMAQLGDMLKACGLALVLGAVGAFYLKSHLDDFALTQAQPLPVAFIEAGSRVLSGLWLLVLVVAVFAVVDVPLQRFMYRSRLKMSTQEVKEENKQQEGSPEIKGRIRQRMREISKRRMLAAVPKADLVVMNPTHFAVAIKYDEEKAGAPRVVAKGADLLAFKIRDLAKEHKVPVLQAPPLARALYANVELEREIPLALYSAVAQVLAYVFQLRNAAAGRGPMPGDLPSIDVPPELDPMNALNTAADAV